MMCRPSTTPPSRGFTWLRAGLFALGSLTLVASLAGCELMAEEADGIDESGELDESAELDDGLHVGELDDMEIEAQPPCDHPGIEEATIPALLATAPSREAPTDREPRLEPNGSCLWNEHHHWVDWGATRLGLCASGELIYQYEHLCMKDGGGTSCGGEWFVRVRRPWWPPEYASWIKIRALNNHN